MLLLLGSNEPPKFEWLCFHFDVGRISYVSAVLAYPEVGPRFILPSLTRYPLGGCPCAVKAIYYCPRAFTFPSQFISYVSWDLYLIGDPFFEKVPYTAGFSRSFHIFVFPISFDKIQHFYYSSIVINLLFYGDAQPTTPRIRATSVFSIPKFPLVSNVWLTTLILEWSCHLWIISLVVFVPVANVSQVLLLILTIVHFFLCSRITWPINKCGSSVLGLRCRIVEHWCQYRRRRWRRWIFQ